MSEKQPFDMEQFMQMQKAMQMLNPPAPPAAPAAAPQGAITIGGINKYWPQLVGIVVLGLFLNEQGKSQQKLESRVTNVEVAVQSINQVKADQTKQTSDMQVLQIDVSAVKQAQKDQAAKLDSVLTAVSTIGQQVQSISQAMRGR